MSAKRQIRAVLFEGRLVRYLAGFGMVLLGLLAGTVLTPAEIAVGAAPASAVQTATSGQNYHITYAQVLARLNENGLKSQVLALQDGIRLIVSEHGCRLLGPFIGEKGESLFWLNKAFSSADLFRAFLKEGWYLGGERIWMAPEIRFNIKDRKDFWGTWHLPSDMEPGRQTLDSPAPGVARLKRLFALKVYNPEPGTVAPELKQLSLEYTIRQAEDPLRKLSRYRELMTGVLFAGYEQGFTLSEAVADSVQCQTWDLIGLNPGGSLLIPASPEIEITDYYEPVDNKFLSRSETGLQLKVTGDRRYKVGLKAAHLTGRAGYLNMLEDGRQYLLVRCYFNNPTSPYVEEPPQSPGLMGDSMHVYNDGGLFGGFGEMEVAGQTIGGATGRSSSTDQMLLWIYVGPPEKIRVIARHLLGMTP